MVETIWNKGVKFSGKFVKFGPDFDPPKKGLFGPVLAGPWIRDFEDPGIRDCWIEDRNLELVPAWD